MKRHLTLDRAAVVLLVAALPLLLAGAGGGASTAPDRWTELVFQARKLLFFSGSLEMERRREAYPGDGPWHGKELRVIETRSGAYALGANLSTTHTTSWIDPATGATVEYVEHKLRERWKQVTFGPASFHQVVRRPGPKQEDDPPETWPVTQEIGGFYKLPDGSSLPEGTPVRDYYNLIGDLGRLTRSGKARADYFVVTKGRLVRFQVMLGEEVERDWKLLDLKAGGNQKVELRLRRMDLKPVGEDPEDVGGFFAMEGGTEIWVEVETGMIVLIGGKLPNVPGRTEIRLTAAGVDGKDLVRAFTR